jgi:type IV pilus assembly protein PilB
MVLVTGPTGSGKTNTLYSSITQLNTPETNIMTAEDPVEFNLDGINQVQTKEQIGLTFAEALRSFLRQDPNIILIGEIRDFETAEIAVKAALTGHLVLSTLHTNDAPGTINRLVNMGIEPFLVATSVNLICAQRLVRRICKHCKESIDLPTEALIDIGFTPEEAETTTAYKGRGCQICNNTGYKGRVGLFEVLEVSDEIREMILTGASAIELKRQAVDEGMVTLRRSGLRKIMDGITTIDEVVRETVF